MQCVARDWLESRLFIRLAAGSKSRNSSDDCAEGADPIIVYSLSSDTDQTEDRVVCFHWRNIVCTGMWRVLTMYSQIRKIFTVLNVEFIVTITPSL